VVIVEGEVAVLGLNFGRPIVTIENFVTWLFPNYFGQYLFIIRRSAGFFSKKFTIVGDCVVSLNLHSIDTFTSKFPPGDSFWGCMCQDTSVG